MSDNGYSMEVYTQTVNSDTEDDYKSCVEAQMLHLSGDDKTEMNLIEDEWTCILCQEDKQVSASDEDPLVMMGYLETSTVLDRFRNHKLEDLMETEIFENFDFLIQPIRTTEGTHLSTCGHVMHRDCFNDYRKKEKEREKR